MHGWTMVLVIALLLVLAALAAASVNRLNLMRRGGTAVIVRRMPASPGSRWRHGIIRYGENLLVFYQLSSLRPGPDTRMVRQDIEIGNRRSPTDSEFDIMTAETVILSVSDADQNYEFALDSGAFTAFMSWVESRPSGRSLRGRH